MAEANLKQPQPLDVHDATIGESFKRWKRQVEIYLLCGGFSGKSKEIQKATILYCAGSDIIDASVHFPWKKADGSNMTVEEKKEPENVFKMIEDYCTPRQSEVLMSYRFWNVTWSTPFDKFLTELKTRADSCNFEERDRMIRDKIVFTAKGKVQELLLRDTTLDLPKATDICRAHEQATSQAREMNNARTVDRVQRESQDENETKAKFMIQDCHFCAGSHERNKKKCPAWGQTCSNCNGRNHFKAKCRKPQKVHSVEVRDGENQSGSPDARWLQSINQGRDGDRIYARMLVNECDVRFQVDSGAEVNTLKQCFVKKDQVQATTTKLFAWNNSEVKPLGEVKLPVFNPKTKICHDVLFQVVDNSFDSLLGLQSSKQMGLITVHEEKFVSKVESGGNNLGDLGEAQLVVNTSIPPRVLPCRKIPIALEEEAHNEIKDLVKRGVLVPVDEPTRWVSQMALPRKSSGKLRVCIDPQPLNEALMREHYLLPTFDDVLPKLLNAKVFSKIDVKEAFWHIRLDKESSVLTTMITPFGRYRWARLPFGLKVSSEIFQKRLHHAIGDLKGVICVADDIVVVGCGETEEEANLDHMNNLKFLMDRCKKCSIKLNEAKMSIKQKEVEFLGHKLTTDGISVSKEKVRAIHEMPPPEDITGVRRLCGMVQYLARYTPNLSGDLEPIHRLTRKDTPFVWSEECENAFRNLKQKLSDAPVLAYYNQNKPLVLQVDSSKDGLGAVLLQDNRPIEYASRNLRSNERGWPQIEKEALAVVWGLEKFDQYTYGRPVEIHNDHKPLETIFRKPLNQAPKRIQGLMMRLFRYDTDFIWVKGSELYLADTLSRSFLYNTPDEEDRRVFGIQSLHIPDQRLEAVRQATSGDHQSAILIQYIQEGWPDHRYEVPEEIKEYFDIRDTLTFDEGIIYKGERLVIPRDLRSDIKARLHASHYGADGMMRRARECVFWPGMSREVKEIADNCLPCQERKPNNQKETLIQHEETQFPWQKIGCDLFTIEGRDYLVVVDYETDFIEVDAMPSTTSARVVASIKKICARYGRPSQLVSDGGPQFASHEFRQFTSEWGIQHVFSSPYHSQSNGKAESAVKIIKNMMYKCMESNGDQSLALLEQRSTPRQDGPSPAQRMFGRKLNTNLPIKVTESRNNTDMKGDRRDTVKKSYDKNARDLPDLKENQPVFFKKDPRGKWEKGQVMSRHDDRSYIILGESGGNYRRNRVHLRPSTIPLEPNVEKDSPETVLDNSPVLRMPTHQITNPENNPIMEVGDHTPCSPLPQRRKTLPQNTGPGSPMVQTRPERNRAPPAYLAKHYDLTGPKE